MSYTIIIIIIIEISIIITKDFRINRVYQSSAGLASAKAIRTQGLCYAPWTYEYKLFMNP